MANLEARAQEAKTKPASLTLPDLAGGERVLQLYEEFEARAQDGRMQREAYPRAVCQLVQKAMEALIAGSPPAPPKPVDARPAWAREPQPLDSPDFLKWKLMATGRFTVDDIEEMEQAGGTRYFSEVLRTGHSKEWVLGELAEEKALRAARNAAIKERWPNR